MPREQTSAIAVRIRRNDSLSDGSGNSMVDMPACNADESVNKCYGPFGRRLALTAKLFSVTKGRTGAFLGSKYKVSPGFGLEQPSTKPQERRS